MYLRKSIHLKLNHELYKLLREMNIVSIESIAEIELYLYNEFERMVFIKDKYYLITVLREFMDGENE